MMMKKKKKIDKDFVGQGAQRVSEEDVSKTLHEKAKIEDKILNSGFLRKYAEISKLMFKMLNDYRRGIYQNVPWYTVSAMAFALLYVLNPFDLAPDFIPGLGYVDDMSVLAVGLQLVQTDVHKYLKWKDKGEDSEKN